MDVSIISMFKYSTTTHWGGVVVSSHEKKISMKNSVDVAITITYTKTNFYCGQAFFHALKRRLQYIEKS